MRRISTLVMIAGALLLCHRSAEAAPGVKVTGTVDWTALTHFNTAQSGEVVLVDITDFNNFVFTVVPLTKISNKQSRYSATLNPNTPYFVVAVIADCASNPETCGTATVAGTHIRFGGNVFFTPQTGGGPPMIVDVIADPTAESIDPVSVCGNISVQSGTYVKSLVASGPGGTEQFFSDGVWSTSLLTAPAASYCVQAGRFSFTELDSTATIQQTQVPTCPAQLDVLHTDFLFVGNDPVTDNVTVVVPGAPGELSGSFLVNGFPHDFTSLFGFASGPTIGDCAGIRTVNSGSGPGAAATFDVAPALSGEWRIVATANRRLNSPDGLLGIIESSTAMSGGAQIIVDLPPGGSAVAPLTFTPGIIAGNFVVDVRRWGAISQESIQVPTFEGIPNSGTDIAGAGWTPSVIAQPPMRLSEHYELNLDPRGANWLLRAAQVIGYAYSFPIANGSASSSFGVATMPNRIGPPFVPPQSGDLSVLVGNVTAGGTITVDVPAADFRVASVTLNPPAGGASFFWSAQNSQYTLPNGLLDVTSANSNAFSFDGSAVVAHATLPPGRYDGSSGAVDANFNFFSESRQLDLEPDDDLTADFGAPALLTVRPIPGAAGGNVTVTGTVVSSDPGVQVSVNGANAPVTGGTFSKATTIGTGPLTVVAHDSQGRTTTLKRYFTTMAGLFAPAAGADLVSQGLDLFALQSFTFVAPTPSGSFNIGRTIPLKLTGSLGGAAVTSANAAAPRIVAVLQVASGVVTTVNPTGGDTVFKFGSGQWTCNLGTTGLTAGTYVVQIQFWDGRILEAALVLG